MRRWMCRRCGPTWPTHWASFPRVRSPSLRLSRASASLPFCPLRTSRVAHPATHLRRALRGSFASVRPRDDSDASVSVLATSADLVLILAALTMSVQVATSSELSGITFNQVTDSGAIGPRFNTPAVVVRSVLFLWLLPPCCAASWHACAQRGVPSRLLVMRSRCVADRPAACAR